MQREERIILAVEEQFGIGELIISFVHETKRTDVCSS